MYVVVGLPGAGKSTVLREVASHGYEIINFGDVMFKTGVELFGNRINTRDDMRYNLTFSEYKRLQQQTGKEIKRLIDRSSNPDKVIIDTHAIIYTPDGYIPGLPDHVISEWEGLSKLILITVPYQDLIERRKNDTSRKREMISLEEYERQVNLTLNVITHVSCMTGCSVYLVENRNGRLEDTVKKMIDVLEE